MKKRFTALLAALLLFCFAACAQIAGTGSGSEKRGRERNHRGRVAPAAGTIC